MQRTFGECKINHTNRASPLTTEVLGFFGQTIELRKTNSAKWHFEKIEITALNSPYISVDIGINGYNENMKWQLTE